MDHYPWTFCAKLVGGSPPQRMLGTRFSQEPDKWKAAFADGAGRPLAMMAADIAESRKAAKIWAASTTKEWTNVATQLSWTWNMLAYLAAMSHDAILPAAFGGIRRLPVTVAVHDAFKSVREICAKTKGRTMTAKEASNLRTARWHYRQMRENVCRRQHTPKRNTTCGS